MEIQSRKIEAIFSDAGGVLFDDTPAKLREYRFLAQYLENLDVSTFLREFQPFRRRAQVDPAYSKQDALRDYLESIGRSGGEVVDKFHAYCTEYERVHFAQPEGLVFPDVRATLEVVRSRGIPFIVLTDTTSSALEVRSFFERLRLGEYVTDIVSSKDLGVKKPDRRFFDHALQRFGLDRDNVLFVAHDLDEIEGASCYGMPVAAVRFSPEIEDQLRAYDIVTILRGFSEFPRLIE